MPICALFARPPESTGSKAARPERRAAHSRHAGAGGEEQETGEEVARRLLESVPKRAGLLNEFREREGAATARKCASVPETLPGWWPAWRRSAPAPRLLS